MPGFGLLPVLAALRDDIEERKLGEDARQSLRQWYWCSVFLERYSSAVESKTRKDYLDMRRLWNENVEPDVFVEARARIGAPGYSVRHVASPASAMYCGVFCLLANCVARDWRRAENIQLQQLQDHHIFPKAYLKRHGVQARGDVNSIVNRTLISNETNGKIHDDAPGEYLADAGIFPKGVPHELLAQHFIDAAVLDAMLCAHEGEPDTAKQAYATFRKAREALILLEVRRACGVPAPAVSSPVAEDFPADDELFDPAAQ